MSDADRSLSREGSFVEPRGYTEAHDGKAPGVRSARWHLLLAALLLLTLTSCTDDDSLAERIKYMPEKDFLTSAVTDVLRSGKLRHVPLLIERMKEASGDIDWIPRLPVTSKTPPRYMIQKAIKTILARDYLQRHPEMMREYSSISMDNSLQLLDWWEQNKEDVLHNRPYAMPRCMVPPSWLSPPYDEAGERLGRLEAECREQNAKFKAAGYKTINERLRAQGLVAGTETRRAPRAGRGRRSFATRLFDIAMRFVEFPLIAATTMVLVVGFVRRRRKIYLFLAAALVLVSVLPGVMFVQSLLTCVRGESVVLTADFLARCGAFSRAGWIMVLLGAAYLAWRRPS